MTQPAKAQEPSMEEILASIRRIIADDEAKPAAAAPAAAAPAAAKPEAAAIKPGAARLAEAPRAAAPARAEQSKASEPPKASQPPKAASPTPAPPAAPPAAASNSQDDIDALLADFDPPGGDDSAEEAKADPDDILDLTESMAVSSEPAFRRIEPHNDLEFAEDDMAAAMAAAVRPAAKTAAAAEAAVAEASVTTPPFPSFPSFSSTPAEPAAPERPLLSTTTIAAVDSAFNTLAHTVLSQNARTLEDLVREMLRPMLKSWLDDNLPGLVERLVKAEIERVARGR